MAALQSLIGLIDGILYTILTILTGFIICVNNSTFVLSLYYNTEQTMPIYQSWKSYCMMDQICLKLQTTIKNLTITES